MKWSEVQDILKQELLTVDEFKSHFDEAASATDSKTKTKALDIEGFIALDQKMSTLFAPEFDFSEEDDYDEYEVEGEESSDEYDNDEKEEESSSDEGSDNYDESDEDDESSSEESSDEGSDSYDASDEDDESSSEESSDEGSESREEDSDGNEKTEKKN